MWVGIERCAFTRMLHRLCNNKHRASRQWHQRRWAQANQAPKRARHPRQWARCHLALLMRMRASSDTYFAGTPEAASSDSLWLLICAQARGAAAGGVTTP